MSVNRPVRVSGYCWVKCGSGHRQRSFFELVAVTISWFEFHWSWFGSTAIVIVSALLGQPSFFELAWQQDLATATDFYRMIEGSIIRFGPRDL
jgi:hypothetical protein